MDVRRVQNSRAGGRGPRSSNQTTNAKPVIEIIRPLGSDFTSYLTTKNTVPTSLGEWSRLAQTDSRAYSSRMVVGGEWIIRFRTIQIPRWYFCESNSSPKIEIHTFRDASEKAYGAIIYLRSIIDGSIHTNLVTSKTRVVPTKKTTLPRLELLGPCWPVV